MQNNPNIPEWLKGSFKFEKRFVVYRKTENEKDEPLACLLRQDLAEIFAKSHEAIMGGTLATEESLIVTDGKVAFLVGKNVTNFIFDDKKVAEKMHNVLQITLPEDLLKFLGTETIQGNN